ncbi:hypothetical protein [Methanolacinia paynteri]|uniref:hypothetical protein n=1 Tax=Methanolacinia paynteri TaxID=230356 RepID=UPI00064FCFE9|nr:hypothetical protein [Methanolacinia paynteri]
MTGKTISPLIVLSILVIFFAGGSIFLAMTLPEGCSDVCGPAVEVHYSDTFYILSPGNIPGSIYYGEPEIEYDGEKWTLPEDYANEINGGHRISDEDYMFPPGAAIPVYTPDMEIKDDKVFFDAIVYNNIGYDLSNVTFSVLFDVTIRKNTDGGYGAYSRYDPGLWPENVTIENLPDNSSKEIRIFAPLFEVSGPESVHVDVFMVLPENLTAADGTLLEFDRSEYIPSVTVPDIYDAGSSGRKNDQTNVFGYYINE